MNSDIDTLNLTKPAGPVMDRDVRDTLQYTVERALNWTADPLLVASFVAQYRDWIVSSKLNAIKLPTMPLRETYAHATQAVTQSIEAFLMQHRDKRFRLFRGEYFASRALLDGFDMAWSYLEDGPLTIGDAVIVSAPFSASGDIHPEMYDMFEKASTVGVPVFVDCAFWGICQGIDLDLTAPCIETIAFSLSKTFWLNGVRIGLQISRNPVTSIALVNERGYINRLGAVIASTLLTHFGPDYIPEKFHIKQHELCDTLKLTPSKTVIFGLGGQEWKEYDRDHSGFNRVCFNRLLTPDRW